MPDDTIGEGRPNADEAPGEMPTPGIDAGRPDAAG